MKSNLTAIVLYFLAINVMAEGDKPQQEGKSTLKIGGLFQATMCKTDGAEEDFNIPNARLSLSWTSANKRWEVYGLINTAQFKDEGSWLMSTSVAYSLTGPPAKEGEGEWKIRAGRVFAAWGYPTPFAAFNETNSYPFADPTQTFTQGLQVEYADKDWLLLFDVSGQSGCRFDNKENWNGWECSTRIQRNFDKSWLALTLHGGTGDQHIIVDSQVQFADNLYVRGALYYVLREDKMSDQFSGYLFTAWEPVPRWELHAMFDYRQQLCKNWGELQFEKDKRGIVTGMKWSECESSSDQDTAVTIGTRVFFLKERNLTVTLDGVLPIGNDDSRPDKKARLEARVSYRFSGKLF